MALAVFLEAAWYAFTGQRANAILRKKEEEGKKKKEESCLVMEFLSFQQDPSRISYNYGQLSYGNYKDSCARKDLSGFQS